jgi:hypothetical protein
MIQKPTRAYSLQGLGISEAICNPKNDSVRAYEGTPQKVSNLIHSRRWELQNLGEMSGYLALRTG